MTTCDELVAACDQLLAPARFKDYTVNGLQVGGRERIQRVMSGVTACQALLDEAVAWQADLVLVHHGYFWKNEPVNIVGMKRRRLATLMNHDINLLAYHLPLDAHATLGNNATLAERLAFVSRDASMASLAKAHLAWCARRAHGAAATGRACRRMPGALAAAGRVAGGR